MTERIKKILVLEMKPQGAINTYQAVLWNMVLSYLLLGGMVVVMVKVWGTQTPSPWKMFAMAIPAVGIYTLSKEFEKKRKSAKLLRFIPWIIMFAVTGFQGYWSGCKAWINMLISGWNVVHEGGVALFTGVMVTADALAFSLLLILIMTEIICFIVAKNRIAVAWGICLIWLCALLICGIFSPVACSLCLAGIFGMGVSGKKVYITKNRLLWMLGMTICVGAAVWICSGNELQSVNTFRQNVKDGIHTLRYGEEQLPEGNLNRASKLTLNSKNLFQIQTSQEKMIYLRGFVGEIYRNGSWEPLPDSVYGGNQAGMLKWLKKQQFDPLTQAATYYSLGEEQDIPVENHIKIEDEEASRYYMYIPGSTEAITKGNVSELKDKRFMGKGIFGQKSYELTELSETRPSELTITASWVSNPQTTEQRRYAKAEAVYREFVYENDVEIDQQTYDWINEAFWKDYESDSDGIYSALQQIRNVLKNQMQYTEIPVSAPAGEEPMQYAFMKSRKGNSVLYASIATEAFRAHGIPARYVEGYYLSDSDTAGNAGKNMNITGKNAHAWVEVYFDGVGWMPVDVTPGYYYDAVTLQQMVNAPDKIHKSAALDNNSFDGNQTVHSEQGKNGEHRVVKKVIHGTLIGLGILGMFILFCSLVFALLECGGAITTRLTREKYARVSQKEKIAMIESYLFYGLELMQVEAVLGWNVEETDAVLAEKFEEVQPGEYSRVCALLEKNIYGEMELEPYEMRLLTGWVEKVLEDGKYMNVKTKTKRGLPELCGIRTALKIRYINLIKPLGKVGKI